MGTKPTGLSTSRAALGGAPIVNPDEAKAIDDENRKRAEAAGVTFEPDVYSEEDLAEKRRIKAETGNTAPVLTAKQKNAQADRDRAAGKLDPTLTDMLLRDIASGQVRRVRSGARRGTFGGPGLNPYETPTLGG